MTLTENTNDLKTGRVVAIAGPVVDVEFPRGSLPEINHALELTIEGRNPELFENRTESE